MASRPANEAPYRLIDNVEFGDDVVAEAFVNLYGCRIGDGSRIGPFVEIQRGAQIGARCKIQSHTFICEGVRIGDGVFVGHGVVFMNDKAPRAAAPDGTCRGLVTGRCSRPWSRTGSRVGCGHPRWCADRCRSDGRRWRCRDQGRRPGRDRCRRPSVTSSPVAVTPASSSEPRVVLMVERIRIGDLVTAR